MMGEFYIPQGFKNDMNLAVQKNHLGGQILNRSPDPPKNRISKKNL